VLDRLASFIKQVFIANPVDLARLWSCYLEYRVAAGYQVAVIIPGEIADSHRWMLLKR